MSRFIDYEPRILCLLLTLEGLLFSSATEVFQTVLAFLLATIAIRHAFSVEKAKRIS